MRERRTDSITDEPMRAGTSEAIGGSEAELTNRPPRALEGRLRLPDTCTRPPPKRRTTPSPPGPWTHRRDMHHMFSACASGLPGHLQAFIPGSSWRNKRERSRSALQAAVFFHISQEEGSALE